MRSRSRFESGPYQSLWRFSGAAFVAKQPELVVLAYVSTAIFWMLDAHNKTYQKVYIRRVHDIELGLRAFQLSGDRISCPRISDDFTAEFSRPMGRRLLQTFRQRMRLGVWLPYFGISALLTAILFVDLGRSQGAS